MNIFTVRATAKKISRRKVLLKASCVVAGISIFILLAFYGMAVFAQKNGSFTVSAPKASDDYNIALCENPEFTENSTKLFADPVDDMVYQLKDNQEKTLRVCICQTVRLRYP